MTVSQLEYKLAQHSGSPVFARLASEYLMLGRISEATSLCKSGLEMFPKYATGYIILAKCCEAEGDYAAAVQSLSSAIDLLPSTTLLHEMHVDFLAKLDPESYTSPIPADQIVSASPHPEPGEEQLDTHEIHFSGTTLTSEVSSDQFLSTNSQTEIADAVVTELSRDRLERELPDESTETPADDRFEPPLPISAGPTLSEDLVKPEHLQSVPERVSEEAVIPENEIELSAQLSQPEPPIEHNDVQAHLEEPPRVESVVQSQTEYPPPMDESDLAVTKEWNVETETLEAGVGKSENESEESENSTLGFFQKPPTTPDEFTSPNLNGRIVSKTLAEIYATQGAIAEAILTYQLLRQQRPELTEECDVRIRELEPKLQEKLSP